MRPGELIERGIGGFQFRGEALKLDQNPDHVPIGLLRKTALRRAVEPGQLITFDDIDILASRALDIVMQQRAATAAKVLQKPSADHERPELAAIGG
jgi:predicted homoserine dehydrogenase-like protein